MPVNNGFTYHEDDGLIFIESHSVSSNIDMFISEIYDSTIHNPYIIDLTSQANFVSDAVSIYGIYEGLPLHAYEVHV